jgi:hypothetical protein
MDTDVTLVEGSLRDLCIPGKVTIPTLRGNPGLAFVAPMLCVPREVALERGIYNKYYSADGFDPEYQGRIQDILEKVDSVKIEHIGGATRFDRV